MNIVVAGKGGSGKTTVAGVMARALASDGLKVIAIDADGNPNLGIPLGLGPTTAGIKSIKNVLHAEDGHHQESESHSIDDLLADFGVETPSGVRLLQMGAVERPSEGDLSCGSHATFRDVYARIPSEDLTVVITDLEAGVNDLLWVRPKPGDVLVLVIDPSRKSLEVGRRILAVAREHGVRKVVAIANKVEQHDDAERVAAGLPGIEVIAVEDDPLVRQADRVGQSVVDGAAAGRAVPAIAELARRLWAEQPALA